MGCAAGCCVQCSGQSCLATIAVPPSSYNTDKFANLHPYLIPASKFSMHFKLLFLVLRVYANLNVKRNSTSER